MVKESLILDIQKMSTEDGPGIRTTVFLKGCNLNCAWCHNPESIIPYPEVIWLKPRCIGCDTCTQTCKFGALHSNADGYDIDRQICRRCMACAKKCPTGALEQKGTLFTCDGLVAELLKDRAYFEKSGGGVTISGGEALIQADFTIQVLQKLHEAGVHTALDTAACVPYATLEDAMQYTDLLLLDIKLYDDALHRKFTGRGNTMILENAKNLSAYAGNHGKRIWVRTPIIPGATDSIENIASIATFISEQMGGIVERWELCAFNNLCRDKYARLGRKWDYEKEGLLSNEVMERLLEAAKSNLIHPIQTVWTGSVK